MQREQTVPGKNPRLFYKEMTGKPADIMPDFRVRVKAEPRTERMVPAADVNSVFDISIAADKLPEILRTKGWYVLLIPKHHS